PDLTGPVTEHCLELLSADIVFQGTDGIGLDGKIYNVDLRLARVEKHMRRIAQRSVVLADHSKIGRTALACSGTLADIDTLITNRGVAEETLRRFARQGAKIVVA
ncbi:MAG TPA: hypothetical protein PLN52_00560, partial [Opitutaceae bacterium]|nr:hypothetical protein [Opitutaceae bacterium]